ncbi:secretin N-terminal domain-containing protein [Chthoniobacter flavus]|uniref:secretin N-terminal domain-containing protein n=1 Tax=Chthoniobacter flavus TaxID=191863 RepID=UPI00138AC620|nr:secretin N-terminal domain-containing protein [Chthoniobacter flavus]
MARLHFLIPLLAGGIALGQNPPSPILPAGGRPPVPEAPGKGSVPTRLQFPNTDVKEVLAFYERLTKKRMIIDNQVQGTVNIVVSGEVPAEEAIRIIEINLLLNGFTLIPVEGTDMVKVVGSGKNPRTAAIPIISDELLLPEGEQVVTYIAKLHYADPTEVQQLLSTFVVPAPGGYTNVTALPKSQTLVITENTATIRGLIRILHEIDIPPAEVISEFIPLERADAKDVLEKLTAIFEKQPTSGSGAAPRAPGAPPAPVPAALANVPPGSVAAEVNQAGAVELHSRSLSEDSIIIGKIKLTADVRTNRIHVVTRPVNMPFVRKLITEFDESVKFGIPVERPLRFISVGDVLDVIVKAITEPGAKEEGGGGGSEGRKSSQQNTAARSTGGTSGGAGVTGSGDSSGTGSEFNVSEELSTQGVDTTPEARVVGTTKIIADKNANKIIIIGGEDVKAKVFRLLDELDQRIPQVMLHTVIGELNLDDKSQFGVDYILRNAGLGLSPLVVNGGNSTGTNNTSTGTAAAATGSSNAGTSTATNTVTPSSTTGTTTTGSTASNLVDVSSGHGILNFNNLLSQDTIRSVAGVGGSGVTGFVTAGNSLTAIVTALMNTNRFRVVTRPSVFTRNNKKAIIASGQEIPVPTSIQSALNAGTTVNTGLVTQSSVQFKRVALQLEVVPLINADREVSLDVLQKIDQVSGSTRIDNNDIPNIATRYVKTSVTVPNEGTVVLGGLIQQSMNKVRSGIPLLSSIPGLGYLFSSTTKEKIRTELVILIRPEVSWAPPEAAQIRERAQEVLSMDPDLEASLSKNGVRKAEAPEGLPTATPTPTPKPKKHSWFGKKEASSTDTPLLDKPAFRW